jgi:hypothetical protein
LFYSLFEAVICHAKYGAWVTWLDEDTLHTIVERIPPLAIGPWRRLETYFFARRGAFMLASEEGQIDGKKGYSVHIGAKTEHPLQFLRPFPSDSWKHVAV